MGKNVWLVLAIAAVGAALFSLVRWVLSAWWRARGERLIVCPETERPAAVELDTRHAALSATLGEPDLRLSACSRWPERAGCGQECLTQIEEAPDGCLVRARLARWYGATACALCGARFEQIHWFDHKPGFLSPEREVLSWSEVEVERLPEVLRTHRPLCWNCSVAESFRKSHPDLVLDDPWHVGRTDPARLSRRA